jgi:hypothetical protein
VKKFFAALVLAFLTCACMAGVSAAENAGAVTEAERIKNYYRALPVMERLMRAAEDMVKEKMGLTPSYKEQPPDDPDGPPSGDGEGRRRPDGRPDERPEMRPEPSPEHRPQPSPEHRPRRGHGPPPDRSDDDACYIATAVYGSLDAPEVLALRSFRDEVLMKSPLGQTFVSVYYEHSPYYAEKLKDHRYINHCVKLVLDKIVELVEAR